MARLTKEYNFKLDGPKNSMKPSVAKPMKPITDKKYRPSVDGPKTPMVNPKMSALRRMRGMK
jgi:hypothetical protein